MRRNRGIVFSIRNWLSGVFTPNYGCCGACGGFWNVVEGHHTFYTSGRGCFPLCEQCWTDLATPAARLPYYRDLFDHWCESSPHPASQWEAIEHAVLAGK